MIDTDEVELLKKYAAYVSKKEQGAVNLDTFREIFAAAR